MNLSSRIISRSAVASLLLTLVVGQSLSFAQTTFVWNNTSSGDWNTAGNWTPSGPASGAGNTADFNSQDINGFIDVGLDSDVTIGHVVIGDTDPVGTAALWTLFDNSFDPNVGTITRTLTLSDPNSTPTFTVNQLGVLDPNGTAGGPFDDFLLNLNLAGTQGFEKNGVGILTLGGSTSGLTGSVALNGGTIRLGSTDASLNGLTSMTAADNTTLVLQDTGGTFTTFDSGTFTADANATVTIQTRGQNLMNDIQTEGGGTLNLRGASNRILRPQGTWGATDPNVGGWDVVNISKTGGGLLNFRPRPNGAFWNTDAFDGAVINLTGVTWTWQATNSGGNSAPMEALNGNAESFINGASNNAGDARYIIGGNDPNTNGDFTGTVNGAQPMSIEKVGTNTQTFSGSFADYSGRAIRVAGGTLKLGGTVDTIQGGTEAEPTVIEVRSGATLDLTDPNSATDFSLSDGARIIGTGTVVVSGAGARNFNHSAGDIAPGDVVNDTFATNNAVSTAGTISLSGNMVFNGGGIAYDMSPDPTDPNDGGDDLIVVTGSTSVAGGGVIKPNFLAGAPDPNLIYTVVESQGGYSDSLSGWTVNWFGRGAAPTPVLNGNLLQFKTTEVGAVGNVTWTGSGSVDPNGVAAWRVQDAGNDDWLLGGSTPDDFFQGDNVTFQESGTASFNVSVEDSVAPSSIVVDSSTNYTFTNNGGEISGTGPLTKRGSSTLTLNGTNSFAGGTTLEGGNIVMGAGGSLGTGSLTFTNNDPNTVTSVTTTASSSSLSGIVVAGFGDNQLILNNGTSWEGPGLTGTGRITYASDDNALRLDLNDVDPNFAGFVTFGVDPDANTASAMTIRLNGGDDDLPNASVTLVDGASLTNEVGSGFIWDLELGALTGEAGTSLVPFVGGGSTIGANWIIGGLNATTEFAGDIIDGGNQLDPNVGPLAIGEVTKIGSGTLTLSGTNSYSGDTSVEGGTLSIDSAYLADAADVFLTTGALFDLNFVGTDIIDSLFIDGVGQVTGTWGALGSGAANQTSLISGTGILSVSTLGSQPGDFDNNGVVNGFDFLAWQRGESPNPLSQADLTAWENNYGTGGAVGAVPEPSSALLLVISLTGMLSTRRRR